MNIIDVSSLNRNNKVYNGSLKKFGVTKDEYDYIVKLPKGNDLSVFSEYISSKVFSLLCVPCQTVYLGLLNGEYVSVIEDFTFGTLSLHSFDELFQDYEDVLNRCIDYSYEDILCVIEESGKFSRKGIVDVKIFVADMLICDAILGNSDRHRNNWGFFEKRNGYISAPIYDNDRALFPNILKDIDDYITISSRGHYLEDKVFSRPYSSISLIFSNNYYEMFSYTHMDDILVQRIEMSKECIGYEWLFNEMVRICYDIPVPRYVKRFYIEIVVLRYMCIILKMDFVSSYKLVEGWLSSWDKRT